MDFTERVKAFAASVPQKLESIKTEEATKNYLVMPFIQQILGYNPFDPNELVPEYDANVGAARKFKLDYAILQDGQPSMLIECKCYGSDSGSDHEWSQLFAYFMATDARIGILSNGVIYNFYADLEKPNKMNKTPFLELDLLNLKESTIRELSKLTKSASDIDDAIESASELKYVGGIKAYVKKTDEIFQMKTFLNSFIEQLCPENNFTGQLKEDFFGYTLRGIKEFITEEMKHLVDDAVNPPEPETDSTSETEQKNNNTEFTEDERERYYIARAILSSVISPSRIIILLHSKLL